MADGSLPIVAPPDVAALAAGAVRKRIIVGFAGGGGSSIGIAKALGVHPDAALNHWPAAIAVHEANFPDAAHYCGDIFETDCRDVLPGEPIGLAWFSPDCRHFSRAKGGTPVSARVRGLAWAIIPWAKIRQPDVIMVENVDEFVTWGPCLVGEDGELRPDPARRGQTFERFVRRLRQCGYVVEWVCGDSAADLGAPTIRKRFLLKARRDGRPIVWPAPTHAPRAKAKAKGLKPYRGAYECIDFSRPCPSIFLTKDEARAAGVKRPLADATYGRISKGMVRHVFGTARPFTVSAAQLGGSALVAANLLVFRGDSAGSDPRDPMGAITANSFIKRPGGAAPLGLAAAFMEQANTGMVGHDARAPLSTIVQKGCTQRLVAAQLTHFWASNVAGGQGDLREPLNAALAQGNHAYLLEASLSGEHPMAIPFNAHGRELRAFLIKYYGTADAVDLADPLGTVTSRSRFGLVIVAGVAFRIVDIGMRMLDPETELAAAMGVPRGYFAGVRLGGKPITKTTITKLVGNMVQSDWAAAHVHANCADLPWWGHQPEGLAA